MKNQIKYTKDYSKFKFIKDNRPKEQPRVDKVKERIERYGFLLSCAIIITRDWLIIDGQHRFWAAEELGIELPYYMVDVDNPSQLMRDLSSHNSTWSLTTHIESNAKSMPQYAKLELFINTCGLAKSPSLCVYTGMLGGGDLSRIIKNKGVLRENPRRAECLDFIMFCKAQQFSHWDKMFFIRAVVMLFNHVEDVQKNEIEKLKKNVHGFWPCGDVIQYIEMFLKFINKQRRATPIVYKQIRPSK